MYNDRHYVKMAPQFFDAKLIRIKFSDKPGEGSTRVKAFKTCRGEETDAPHNTETKPRLCENTESENAYNDCHMYCVYTTII
jgi:hypothetical protein